jgi:serine/threonine-protein kinase
MKTKPDKTEATIDAAPDREPISASETPTTRGASAIPDQTIEHSPDSTAENRISVSSATVSIVVGQEGNTENEPAGLRADTLAAVQAAAPPGYEILRVLGRGGMGVVYEARQRALKRRVALKMVTAGVHTDPAQLVRFQIEAEAVASLQHPNIVQIYEVGEHQGIPFFSLELVDGGTLEGLIKQAPLSVRDAAEMTRQLADAMNYAHVRGIIHRDLKPGNVLVTADGQPKITDFGLAKRLDVTDLSQTQAGTILGTPSYMAPEQAAGDIAALGPASDIYGLGALLYRLLTGQPPFASATLIETLDAVRTQEPVPVRQIEPKVPHDLETICMTCLQKAPARRYASAEALARDLKHFLASEPIEARPVSAAERFWRWCQRNPVVASLAAVVFALLATVAVTSSVLLIRIAQEKQQTEVERQAAVSAQALAEKNEAAARDAEKKAQENAQLATEQGRLAVNTFYNVVTKVQQQLKTTPDNQKLRQELLTDAFSGMEKLAKGAEASPLLARTRLAAFQNMGDIARDLGRTEEALQHYEKYRTLVEAIAAANPNDQIAIYNRGVICRRLAESQFRLLGDAAAARGYYRQCLDCWRSLTNSPLRDPELKGREAAIKVQLVRTYAQIGDLSLMLGDPGDAWEQYQQMLKLQLGRAFSSPSEALAAAGADPKQFPIDLSRHLGDVCVRLGDVKAARGWFGRALQLSRAETAKDVGGSQRGSQELAASLAAQGHFEMLTAEPAKALDSFVEAHRLYEELVTQDPKAANPRRNLAQSHYALGAACLRLGQTDAANDHFRECLKIREQLVKDDPNNTDFQIDLMLAQARCGRHAEATKQARELRRRAPHNPAVLFQAACGFALSAGSVYDEMIRSEYLKQAIETMHEAVARGYRDIVALKGDPDLDLIRGDPRFGELLIQAAPKSAPDASPR